MPKELRIVFMGTPDFAVATLDAIYRNNYNIVGVITAPDRPAGRGQKIRESAVKKYAKNKGITILQPTNLKNESFNDALKALNPNLQIVVAFRMLPKIVWQLPEYGTFNLHASLLPNYRGAAPINWAIINGDVKTGVTTFFIDEKIDTGEVIFQNEVEILPDETAGTLHDKLMNIGSELVLKTIDAIESGEVKTLPQSENANLNSAHKLNKDNCKIDWSASIDTIYNHIRGLSPYPAAWCILKNDESELAIKIYKVDKEKSSNNDAEYGHITLVDKKVKVKVNGGYIILDEIQLPGKRKMAIKDLINGFTFHKNAKLL